LVIDEAGNFKLDDFAHVLFHPWAYPRARVQIIITGLIRIATTLY
jgi:hypothetical protein